MNERIIDELKLLFEFCPPEKLRQRLTFLYFQYLQGEGATIGEKTEFRAIAEDIYFLIRFLEIAETEKTLPFTDENSQN